MSLETRVLNAMNWLEPPPEPDMGKVGRTLLAIVKDDIGEIRFCKKGPDACFINVWWNSVPLPDREMAQNDPPFGIVWDTEFARTGFLIREFLTRIRYDMLAPRPGANQIHGVLRDHFQYKWTRRSCVLVGAVQAVQAEIALANGESREKWEPRLKENEPFVSLLEQGCHNVRLMRAEHGFRAAYCFQRPTIKLDGGVLHNPDGPAVTWTESSTRLHYWRGSYIGDERPGPPSYSSIRQFDFAPARQNIELERYGWEKVITDGAFHPLLISSDEYGHLYRIQITGVWQSNTYAVVRVENATVGPDGEREVHWLSVPPRVRTPRQAVAWSYGMDEHEYDEKVRT